MTLEEAVNDQASELLLMSWQTYANNEALALRLGELMRLLRRAGLPYMFIRSEWDERFEKYKSQGGRAPYRELKGYDW